jgi:chromatin-remodeling ATPase INO80
MNGESSSHNRPYVARSPTTQTEFHPPYSPSTNGTSRPQFNNPYHPSTTTPVSMPASSHIPGPTSPTSFGASRPGSYQSDYQPAPRDKPVSNYYDPTSDSSERRPSEPARQIDSQMQTPKVRLSLFQATPSKLLETSSSNTINQNQEPYTYPRASAEPPKYYNGTYSSPVAATFPPRSPISHSHPQTRPISQSPRMAPVSPVVRPNGAAMGGSPIKQEVPVPGTVRKIHSLLLRV